MTQEQILWLVIGLVALILVIVVIAVVVGRKRRQQREADRASAEQLRRDASRQQDRVAAETESAESARLEAEAAEADARRLREQAEERERVARDSQKSLDDQLRTADRLDPGVDTDRDGRRKDGSNPADHLKDAGTAAGAGSVAGAHRADPEDRHDDGHAPHADGSRHEGFQAPGQESSDEHDLVERRMTADPAAEPQESVAAERLDAAGHQDGSHAVEQDWDQYGEGTRPPRG